jgi:hypothetical protein
MVSLTAFLWANTNSAAPEDDTCVRHEDSNDNDSHSRDKPAQMGLRTSKMKGFLSAMIKNTHQEKNAAKENHSTNNDLCEVLKWSGIFFLFAGI